jgi:hypothetical protein
MLAFMRQMIDERSVSGEGINTDFGFIPNT